MLFRIDNYVIATKLGKDGLATYWCATNPDGARVALKVYKIKSSEAEEPVLKALMTEVKVYQKLSHPTLIKLIDFCLDTLQTYSDGRQVRVAYMVLEYI